MNTLRSVISSILVSLTLSSTLGCSTAYADRDLAAARIRPASSMVGPRIAIAMAPVKLRAPYDVQVLSDDGSSLATYAQGGRYYVLGDEGQRYTVHIKNPTARRIEAVVTVDGLDVIDGENGDLKKRGYIIAPYGELRVDGFRTSTSEVATFRFSTVDGSYAGKKGKARNVGVVAVALFEEDAGARIARPAMPTDDFDRGEESEYRRDAGSAPSRGTSAGPGSRVSPKKAAAADSKSDDRVGTSESARAPVADRIAPTGGGFDSTMPMPAQPSAPRTNRPGLGTEFGESRYSPTQFTQFMRSSTKPVAIAELRYNDVSGLRALGIDVAPSPSPAEIDTRESADPFPGEPSFARPPR